MKNIRVWDVKIKDGFWKSRQDMLREVTLGAVYDRFSESHRFEALKCEWKEGQPNQPHIYWDSDVAKWIESLAFLMTEERNPDMERIADEAISYVVKNADETGYFNSHFIVTGEPRFAGRCNHELYCLGHWIEAAVAYYDATKKDDLLKAVCRYTDYVIKVFMEEQSAPYATPGHPEIEHALIKLYHTTGEERYFKLSQFFIDIHGNNEKDKAPYDWSTLYYNQDEMPIRQRSTAEGHSVRAMYLMSAVADIVAETGDAELKAAAERVFENVVKKRMYVTGGVGSTGLGEAFSVDYDLPNRTAYAETCAAISLAMFANRMLSIEADSKYADAVERVFYNGMLSGISANGKGFFYVNPIAIDTRFNNVNPATVPKTNFPATQRAELFGCSCCPPNIMRTIAAVGDYMYTYSDDTLFVNQYVPSETETDGMYIRQETDYPVNGTVRITYRGARRIALRIPSWCKKFTLNRPYTMERGYACIEGEGEILLEMDMSVRFIAANRNVHENTGRVAVMRGPVVYCAEGTDNEADIFTLAVDTKDEVKLTEDFFGLPTLTLKAYRRPEREELYFEDDDTFEETTLKMIPYYAFANRGESDMIVWVIKK